MLRQKPLFAAAALLTACISSGQFTDVINSNRPGESMSAFSVGKTVIQAEAGTYISDEKYDFYETDATGFGGDLAVRYGAFFEQLELILELQYQRDHVQTPVDDYYRNGFRQTTFGAKYLIYDPNKNYEKKPDLYSWKANHSFSWHEFIPAVAAYAGFNLNFFNSPYYYDHEEKVTPKFMIITQNQFGKWVLVTNFIADRIVSKYMSYGFVGTVTRGFNERWSGFLEGQAVKSDQYSDMIFRAGAAYLIKENIQIDASFGTNVKDTPSILSGGIGISWRFDENYEDVVLRAPKEDKKDKKSKEEKKKEKEAKKRKDAIEGTGDEKP